jgi:site-specific DNA-methyltransferase (cytosine-N4-specific)
MKLVWHNYRYYPYERELARRESASLLPGVQLNETIDGLEIVGTVNANEVKRLTYFSGLVNGQSFTPTVQNHLESQARTGKNRQATRYSVHGLHEYKGKFNPQVAKSLLNIFGAHPRHSILDPFCGSGTTLVECSHMRIRGVGIDLNPFAAYIANAKLLALTTPAAQLRSALDKITDVLCRRQCRAVCTEDNRRKRYLKDWFDQPVLQAIENVRINIENEAGSLSPVFLTIASNLIRAYSRQDPHDLRIRRRKSPLPGTPFVDAFLFSANQSLVCIEGAQSQLDGDIPMGQAILCDARDLGEQFVHGSFDAAVTSPPYATALPYIDTQRLSLVWLQLLDVGRIHESDSGLIGSREILGKARRKAVEAQESNSAGLPDREAEFCAMLQQALGPDDGFRRKAVPSLLYRYFAAMRDSFTAIRQVMKPRAPFGLIVGHNHTVLGKVRYDINTPAHLASLAEDTGWAVEEILELQTYQRYGYHMNNAVSSESLIILRA